MTKRTLITLGLLLGGSAQSALWDPRKGLEPIHEVRAPDPRDYPSDRWGKVAVVQWAPHDATPLHVPKFVAQLYKAKNWAHLDRYIVEAALHGAKLVVTPEFATVGYPDIPALPAEEDDYQSRDDIAPYVEPVPGPTTNHFARLAKQLGIYLHIGLPEVDVATQEYFNSVVVLNPQGEVIARYRKMNLWDGEEKFLSPGTDPILYTSPFGNVGLAVCADIGGIEPLATYRKAHVQTLALSTSWIEWNTGMKYFALAAQSLPSFLLAANQIYFPDSGVINPDGTTQSHIRQSEGVAYGYLPYVSREEPQHP